MLSLCPRCKKNPSEQLRQKNRQLVITAQSNVYVARFSRWRHALSWCANHQTHAQRNHLHHQLGYIHSRLLRLSMTLHQTENTSTDATPGHTWTMNPWPPFHARSKRARGRSGCVHRKEINSEGSSMLESGSWVPSVKTSSICMRAIWMFFFFLLVVFANIKHPRLLQLFTRILQQHCLAAKRLQCFVDWQTSPNFLLTPCFHFWANSSFNRSVKSDRFPAEQYWFSQNNRRCLPHRFTVLKVTGFFCARQKIHYKEYRSEMFLHSLFLFCAAKCLLEQGSVSEWIGSAGLTDVSAAPQW